MAYSVQNPPIRHTNRVGGGTYWWYSSADSVAVMSAAGYITNAQYLRMEVGDILVRVDPETGAPDLFAVGSISGAGAATLVPDALYTALQGDGVCPEDYGWGRSGVDNDDAFQLWLDAVGVGQQYGYLRSHDYDLSGNFALAITSGALEPNIVIDWRAGRVVWSGTGDFMTMAGGGNGTHSKYRMLGGKFVYTGVGATSFFRASDMRGSFWLTPEIRGENLVTRGFWLRNDTGWSERNTWVNPDVGGCQYGWHFQGASSINAGGGTSTGTESFARTILINPRISSAENGANFLIDGAVYDSDIGPATGNLSDNAHAVFELTQYANMSGSCIGPVGVEGGASSGRPTYAILMNTAVASPQFPMLREFDLRNLIRKQAYSPASITLTAVGTTATATLTSHGLAVGDLVTIYGATETQYNVTGALVVSVPTANTFTYTMSGSPASPATGSPFCLRETFKLAYSKTVMYQGPTFDSNKRTFGFDTTYTYRDRGTEFSFGGGDFFTWEAHSGLGPISRRVIHEIVGSTNSNDFVLGGFDFWNTNTAPGSKIASIRVARSSATDDGYVQILTKATGSALAAIATFLANGLTRIKGLAFDTTTATVASGVITATGASMMRIDTEGGAATDDLDTINGGTANQILILKTENNGRDVVVKRATGNIQLNAVAGDCTLGNRTDRIVLQWDQTISLWVEISRSINT